MQGTRSHQLALIAALLALGAGAAGADGIYDRKLEKAVKAIIARKVDGPLRGSLEREWRPTAFERRVARSNGFEPAPQTSILTLVQTPSPASATTASIETLRSSLPGG